MWQWRMRLLQDFSLTEELMTDKPDEPRREKKAYSKPDINQVALRPEEAVLGACKTTGVSGPGSGSCSVPLPPCSSVLS
jgi:hypothetical protein